MEERSWEVEVPAGEHVLPGTLDLPHQPRGLVVFAHGSGSSRFSPRNRQVGEALRANGLGTLLMDLLTAEEDERDMRTGELRFDIELLGERLIAAVDWVRGHPQASGLQVGCFGASTGAAAALVAAARRPGDVHAVVSRGGRPDLAAGALPEVRAPTLFIVGSRDETVLDLNRRAMRVMRAPTELQVVPGATHLFEEPGALETVASLAAAWFLRNLRGREPGTWP